MARTGIVMLVVSLIAVAAACGDNTGSVTPDAASPDAPIDMPPAPTCSTPSKMCGTACLDVSVDELNCGDCGVACNGGESCMGTCACPAAFVPAVVEPSQFDMFMGGGGGSVAIGLTFEGGINPLIIGYTSTTPLDTDIDLATVPIGDLPFVAAGYNLDLGTLMPDSAYLVTAGTLRLTAACGTNAQGTLTGATFSGVLGGFADPEIDPAGCTFTVPTVTFDIGNTPCP